MFPCFYFYHGKTSLLNWFYLHLFILFAAYLWIHLTKGTYSLSTFPTCELIIFAVHNFWDWHLQQENIIIVEQSVKLSSRYHYYCEVIGMQVHTNGKAIYPFLSDWVTLNSADTEDGHQDLCECVHNSLVSGNSAIFNQV